METTVAKDDIEAQVMALLETVPDPEIPVLNVVEMAMIAGVRVEGENKVVVRFLPTFTGCPAIQYISNQIVKTLEAAGFSATVEVARDKKWSTDDMTAAAKEKLEKFGIAPPAALHGKEFTAEELNRVRCPHCGSTDTTLRSAFGSTLCRAIRFCFSCKQGFEQFKPL
ncbi:MAG: 1,2-phenylacetyl-CoA epoxidase subunit PaaD [Chitinophagales bacterium]